MQKYRNLSLDVSSYSAGRSQESLGPILHRKEHTEEASKTVSYDVQRDLSASNFEIVIPMQWTTRIHFLTPGPNLQTAETRL